MPTCATECLIEYIAKLQARGESCLKGLRLPISGYAIQFTGGNWMRVLHLLVLAHAVLAGSPATAQTTYPDRPIKMIVPLAAARAVGVAARIVTQKMADSMGQQFVIMNQTGASVLLGAEQVAAAEPESYTTGGLSASSM